MELDAVIKAMEANDGQTKTAAEQPAAPVENTQLDAALEKAAGAPAQEIDAVDVLMKTANELAGTEKEADISHAALCGQAFADGAIAKLAAYDAQVQRAALEEEKVAMAQGYQQPVAYPEEPKYYPEQGMSKVAAESMEFSDDEVVKLAADAGYQATLEKVAEDYNAGHDAALQEVHDTAATEFLKGAAETETLLNMIEQQQ